MLLTSRHGGVSGPPYRTWNLADHVGDDPAAVEENRRRLAERTGVPVRFMRQVHGAHVATVDGTGPPPEADAMVTDRPGVGLAVLVADCVPVLLVAPGVVGVAHAGRRGTADGVVTATVEAMERLGADRAAITATLGPAVCGDCYEVPAAMRDDVAERVPEAWAVSRAGTPSLDLRAGLAAQLSRAGVGTVHLNDTCTAEDPELFSYRRDGDTGRFAGVVWLP